MSELNHDFCSKFRAEIKNHGLVAVIGELLTSKSDKVALKKKYLARECRKNSFAGKFDTACAEVIRRDKKKSYAVSCLRKEIVAL